jgi:hypothetical protein
MDERNENRHWRIERQNKGQRTYLFRTLKIVLRFHRDSKQILVRIDQAVFDRDNGGVIRSQADTRDILNGGSKVGEQRGFLDIEDGGGEHVPRIIDLLDDHTVCEGRDVQHVEQSCFRGTDFGVLDDKMDFIDDFDRTTGNFGGNTEG